MTGPAGEDPPAERPAEHAPGRVGRARGGRGRRPEVFISVDVETSGPVPGRYSMLALGACVVGEEAADEGAAEDAHEGAAEGARTFYVELQPVGAGAVPDAMRVVGRPLEAFAAAGLPPDEAMRRFASWVAAAAGGGRPVFVAFNAPFDWAFVNWYFHEFLGKNPFGFTALDIKAYYMGLASVAWADTSAGRIPAHLKGPQPHTHHALDDAVEQAQMFARMRRAARVSAA